MPALDTKSIIGCSVSSRHREGGGERDKERDRRTEKVREGRERGDDSLSLTGSWLDHGEERLMLSSEG